MNDELVFQVRMSADDLTAYLELRSDEPITYQIMIDALRDLADQMEQDGQLVDDRH